jgi:PAS domain S-box-containing protein
MSAAPAPEYKRETEQNFRLLVESVIDYGIFMLDPEGHVASWNLGAERIKGYKADEIIGRHFSVFYPKEAQDSGWPQHELAIAKREGRFEDEGWRVRKDGSRFWANVVITAVRDETGTLRGFAKVTRDLTERKRVEELEEAEKRINEFLAMLGHELRNPLAPIRNAVSILRAQPTLSPIEERVAGVIDRQLGHLTRLVDDLLDVSRITSGKIALRNEILDLIGPVTAAIEACRPMFDRKRQHFAFHHDGRPVRVTGDATRLTQIVVNLLTNASKYTPPGGHVTLTIERTDHHALIQVKDDGIGIPPASIPRMFDLFVQGERGLDRSEGGLGLGLTLVRRLVQLHSGTVTAISKGAGQGTTFEVRLPLSEGSADTQTRMAGAVAEHPHSAARRVLVVDDNEDSAETMVTLLTLWGHEVRSAGDAESALAVAAEQHPEVVLLDIGLPGSSGYDIAAHLRGIPGCEAATLVAMTGYGQEEDRKRSREAGFAHHLTKPVQPDALKEILASLP